MTKKQTELSEELREAVFEAARAGAAEAYTQNTGYVNYFKAMETLLYNYKKLAALVADEEAYCEVEYHAGRKTFSTTPQAKRLYSAQDGSGDRRGNARGKTKSSSKKRNPALTA